MRRVAAVWVLGGVNAKSKIRRGGNTKGREGEEGRDTPTEPRARASGLWTLERARARSLALGARKDVEHARVPRGTHLFGGVWMTAFVRRFVVMRGNWVGVALGLPTRSQKLAWQSKIF